MYFTTTLTVSDNHIAKKLAIPANITDLVLRVCFVLDDEGTNTAVVLDTKCIKIFTENGEFIPTTKQSKRLEYMLTEEDMQVIEASCLEFYHEGYIYD